MNWLISHLTKEARGRRYQEKDRVRYFTENRKGKGRGVVLTPSFSKGTIESFDSDSRRYKVRNDQDEIMDIHPRNLIPDYVGRSPVDSTNIVPNILDTPMSNETITEEIIT